MRAIKSKKVLIVAFSVIAALIVSIGVWAIAPKSVEAQTIQVNNIVESEVALNTELEVPESVSIEHNGTHTAENGVIVFPSGEIVTAGKIKVNQAGIYQLKYYFEDGGVRYTVVQEVEVYSDYFNLSNPNGGEIIVSDAENPLYCGKDGVIANLKSGTTFVYNKVVDLRECGEDGLSNIIELDTRYGHFEDGAYVQDCLEAWVRVTDCYNPNIYMEIRMQNAYLYNGALYPGVRTNRQPVTGMDKGITQVLGSSRIIKLDGVDYRVWQKEGSMSVGMYGMSTKLTTGAAWKYDMETQRVYMSYNNGDNFLVSDLDEPLIYTDGSFFSGFTTGEVFVSVYASGYESAYARTEIISIGNDNLKEVASEKYVDTVAPQVIIDQEKTTQTGVYGAVGDVFTIPQARAIDVNLVGGIDVAVYRSYNTAQQTNVSVVDGAFTMSHKDLYTIVYKAKDKTGNVGTSLFTVSTMNTADNRAITLQTLQADNFVAGEAVGGFYEVLNSLNVPEEDVQVTISVESENQTLFGQGKDFSFTPYYAGEYTITYQYTDGVFAYEKTISVQCEKSSTVCFMDELVMPKYYVKGFKYAVEDVKAYTFVNGAPEAVETTVYAVFDNGAETLLSDINEVEMTGNESVYFLYKASNGVTMKTDAVSIINAEYRNALGKVMGYDTTKFFVGDFSANALKDGKRTKNITFTSNATSGNNTLSFFNAISGRRFSLEYKIVENEDKFGVFRIHLTDSRNSANKMFFDIHNANDGTYISINGGALKKVDSIAFSNTIIKVSYDYDSKFLRVNEFSASVDFDAPLVYLDMEMMDITGKGSIIVSQLNGMTIAGNNYVDSIAPDIYIYDFQGDYQIGDVITVSVPEFSDVVSGINYASARMMITCSDGGVIYDSQNNPLNNADLVCGVQYEFKLDRLAKFYVIYEIYDFNDNVFQKTVTVNCADTELPTIRLDNLKDGETIRIKAGETVKIDFTVSDNVTQAKEITTYIHLYCIDMFSYVPNVSNIKKADAPENGEYKEKFVISIKGKYQAQINAQDAEGNLSVKYINIIVE